jgi:hypothetical protein
VVGYGTTLAEARTLVSYVSLSGVVYPLASIMPELPEERTRLLKMTMPTMPVFPVDLFSRGTDMTWDKFKHTTPDEYIHNYPEILNVKVNAPAGIYDVVGLTNWRSVTCSKDVSFSDQLGLPEDQSFVVFDFWGQKLLGVFGQHMKITIDPHDTRVLFVHPNLNRPQLIGTSRHITGAYSIKTLNWDNTDRKLRGSSETVPGDPYSVFIFVPDGMKVAHTKATSGGKQDVPVNAELSGNSLKITFKGQLAPVEWEAEFTE